MLSVDVLVIPGSGSVGVAATVDLAEALSRSHATGHAPAVDVRVVGGDGGAVDLRGGLSVAATPLSEAGAARPWVVVPGIGCSGATEIERRLGEPDARAAARWLADARHSRIAASCTGTFLAAEAGVLADRNVTTTWWLAGVFARRYPTCHVDADRMLVRDRSVLTAGAVLGHVDLLLAIVEEAFGSVVARSVAARIAVAPRVSQTPFRRSEAYRDIDPDLATVEQFVLDRLDHPIRLSELAAATHLSTRTLTRRIHATTGLSPIQFAQRIKVEAALDLLRDPHRSVADVARSIGLADASALNRLLRRTTGHSPGAFRSG
ncbi:GlxA family transcriptional regulator [Nocardia bovistercoris]|uniref:Helix-turn-helix domain-containing protein n=1 Tax=Nocardia bovistercoris TaxID=2785916 RepID=A0A931N5D3_9NOCA|nr:helix-turn-helix domain-containing protein [Nocardia bovistercoris]MBH0779617.1 helix-turn-helix domain-containing protein [Nocardia bovistercoris]